MRFSIVVAGILLASACGQNDPSNDTYNGAESASRIELPRAGRYKITEISEVVGATGGIAGDPQTHEACLPDQSEGDLLVASGMNCTPEQLKVKDGEVSATMRCNTPGTAIQDARLEYQGSYSAEGAELTGDVVTPQGMIRLTRELERLGDC
jgi:hypothetical protein